jgi:hypothetical protein
MQVKHKIKIDGHEYLMKVAGKKIGGDVYIEADSAIGAQIDLALQLLGTHDQAKKVTPELFNFFLDTTGLRAKEIAEYVGISPAHISQYRREKRLSAGVWQMFRIFFWDFFTHGKATIPIFKWNKEKTKVA